MFVLLTLLWAFAAAAPAGAAVPPGNDDFSAAAAIQGEEGHTETRTAGATKETGEPAHAGNPGGASVWYRWTAPRDGTFAFETAESDFDTVLAVYTGAAVGTLDQLAADDDSGRGSSSELSFRAIAGTVYRVAVDGFQGKVGRVRLAWRAAQPNDNFADARTLEGLAGTAGLSGSGATAEAGEPDHSQGSEADGSVWFRWTAPADMPVAFQATGGLAITYTGASLNTLVRVAAGGTVLDARAGVTYWTAVEGATDGTVLSWRTGAQPNDNFADAATIVGPRGVVRGSNFPASREADEPEHGGSAGSVWYRWRAPRTGFLHLRVTGDAILAVYRGRRVSKLRQLAFRGNEILMEVQRRRVYRIAVDGSRMGDFELRWSSPDAQPNDDFAHATRIVGPSGRARGSNYPSNTEAGEPDRHPMWSVWYRWRAPRAGILRLRTTGNTFDTFLAVYRGSRLRSLRLLARNDDSGPGLASQVRIPVRPGRVYRIAVTGFGVGRFVLRWNLSPHA